MADWNCPGYAANISDRQCLINSEVRRHWEQRPVCPGCARGAALREAQPELWAEVLAQYRTDWSIRKFLGQDPNGWRFRPEAEANGHADPH